MFTTNVIVMSAKGMDGFKSRPRWQQKSIVYPLKLNMASLGIAPNAIWLLLSSLAVNASWITNKLTMNLIGCLYTFYWQSMSMLFFFDKIRPCHCVIHFTSMWCHTFYTSCLINPLRELFNIAVNTRVTSIHITVWLLVIFSADTTMRLISII